MKKLAFLLVLIACLTANEGCQPVPFKDFDIGSTTFDPNVLPLNPKWGKQIEANQLPDPNQSCPTGSDNPADWTSTQHPNCTSMGVYFNSATVCGPHANFIPVCYEGVVSWGHHSSSIWPFGDDDYGMSVERDDQALCTTKRSSVKLEFDSDETVDNWDDTHTWWDHFHHDGVDHDDATASSMINGDSVIVIGLVGLDLPHDGYTELHPVYAMFVHLKGDDPAQATWAFFLRNWGDEGYCSSDQENLYLRNQIIKVMIPNAVTMTAANTWIGAENADDLTPMGWSVQPSGGGILLTFKLLTPESQSWFVGDLTFTTRVRIHESAPPHLRAKNNDWEEEGKPELGARVSRLPDSVKVHLYAQLHKLVPRKKPVQAKPSIITVSAKLEEEYHERPVKVEGANPVRPQKDTKLAMRREARQRFVEKFLSDRGIK